MSESEQNKKQHRKLIDDAVAELGRIAFDQPAICTGWVLVSEWFGGKNEYWVQSLHDDQSPPWRHTGMLDYAQNRLTEEVDDYFYATEIEAEDDEE